tara:strand:+ start:466 stop:2022 length:1557 start_codon:yes stop_codon:yes gene_type:complete
MAYAINKTDGTVVATVADGTLDTTSSSLSLIGKNYAGYGEVLNENQVKILENFANTSSNTPTSPLQGQIWYNTTANQLQVYNGSSFKSVSGANVSASEPTNTAQGDLWYDSTNGQLYVYNGTSFVLVGPQSTSGSGITGSVSTTITDNTGIDRTVLQFKIADTIVGMLSSVEFTPQTAISGFSTISKGFDLSTAITSNKFVGTATDADALGGVAAASYLRADTNDTTSGTLGVLNDTGLTVGVDSDFTISQSGANTTLKNVTQDGDIIFNVNDGGSDSVAITIDGATNTTSIANLTVTGTLTTSGDVQNINVTNLNIQDPLIVLGSGSTNTSATDKGLIIDRGVETNAAFIWDESADEFAAVLTTETGTTAGNVSISSYTRINATATAAQYSDLAERYETDENLQPGDVVNLGGNKEIRKCTAHEDECFGVISTNPAFEMNAGAGPDSTHPFVALAGRVPCKVEGVVAKGSRLVPGPTPGVAVATDPENITMFNQIGRALEDKDSDNVGTIEIVVGKC